MKLKIALLLAASAMAWQVMAAEPKAPTTPGEKVGYALGLELAGKLKKERIDFNVEMAIQGLRDAMASTPQMSDEEVRFVMSGFQAEVRRRIATNKHLASLEGREKSEAFMAANKSQDGVVTLPSGVQYKVLKAGDGAKPRADDVVQVNYKGSLIDGSVFDQSIDGKPARLKVAALIVGWRELMQLMPVGAKWQVWIPPKLAYGERGAGEKIGPNAVLAFDIELLTIGG
jgi:FKBP-type peptidyl-prolyl cis-trans isomerase FklB